MLHLKFSAVSHLLLFLSISLCHKAYAMKMLWHTMKKSLIEAMHDGECLERLTQWKCGSNLWKYPHFEGSVKGFSNRNFFTNFVWKHIPSIWTQKCGSFKNYKIKVGSHSAGGDFVYAIFPTVFHQWLWNSLIWWPWTRPWAD